MLRDLKRIHSYIAALAYPVLDRPGRMQERVVDIPVVGPTETEEPLVLEAMATKPQGKGVGAKS